MRRLATSPHHAMLAFLAMIIPATPAPAAGTPAPLRPDGPPEIVIYHHDVAYIREPYRVTLAKGENEVLLEGAPRRIDSTSVRLVGPGLDVRQQSFRYDLWSSDKVFRKFLGDSIHFRWSNRPSRGVLVGIDGDEIFIRRGDDSTDALLMVRRSQVQELEFPARPGPWGLAATPSLRWRVRSDAAGERRATLSYLTAGLHWSTEYVAMLSNGERSLSLSGWASISNQSGASFQGCKLSLVAGEVNRVGAGSERGGASIGSESSPSAGAPSELFAYKLYSIPDRIDLPTNGSLQIPLVTASSIAARREYRFDGARDGTNVQALVAFENNTSAGLGVPLPAGRVRVFAADPGGATTLVGEDAIPHTQAGSALRLACGVATDLVGERTRVAHARIARNITEDQFRIRLRNAGGEPVVVTVAETLYGTWEITQRSGEFRTKNAEQIEFDLTVPARGEKILTYTVRYTY
jgi:hypothetical protein